MHGWEATVVGPSDMKMTSLPPVPVGDPVEAAATAAEVSNTL